MEACFRPPGGAGGPTAANVAAAGLPSGGRPPTDATALFPDGNEDAVPAQKLASTATPATHWNECPSGSASFAARRKACSTCSVHSA